MFEILGTIFLVLVVIYLLLGAWQYVCLVIHKELTLGWKQGLRYILAWPIVWLAR